MISTFIEQNALCDPGSHKVLTLEDLHFSDGRLTLLNDPQLLKEFAASTQGLHTNQDQHGEFGGRTTRTIRRLLRALGFNDGFRSHESVECESAFFEKISTRSLCVSIGGGPKRVHPQFLNMNIGSYFNVDLIADAHALPFADNSIDFIHVDAVLEHLHDPARAVREMERVLKPGGQVFAITPFLQGYHGYPNHYQNFTVTGHELLFTRAGLKALRAGVDLGPMNALVIQGKMLLPNIFPGFIGRILIHFFGVLGLILKPFDPLICRKFPNVAVASTTFVWSQKPK